MARLRHLITVALVSTLATSCGAQPDEALDSAAAAQSTALAAAPQTLALVRAKGIMSAAVLEDPTIDPKVDAATNAQSVCAQLKSETTAKQCKAATVSCPAGGTAVTVSFSGDCAVHGMTVSGQLTIDVSGGKGAPVSVSFTFNNLTLNAYTLKSGIVRVSTSDAVTYTTETDAAQPLVTGDGTKVNFKGSLTSDSQQAEVTITGSGSSQGANDKYPVSFTADRVHQVVPSCYPDGGALSQTTTMDVVNVKTKATRAVSVQKTATFDRCTPVLGQVSVTVSSLGQTTPAVLVPLPPYGMCPPTGATCAR